MLKGGTLSNHCMTKGFGPLVYYRKGKTTPYLSFALKSPALDLYSQDRRGLQLPAAKIVDKAK